MAIPGRLELPTYCLEVSLLPVLCCINLFIMCCINAVNTIHYCLKLYNCVRYNHLKQTGFVAPV